MEAPLLAVAGADKKHGSGGAAAGSLVRDEVKKQLCLAGPLVAGYLLVNAVQMISLMFVGHLGNLELADASIATSFATVTGFSLPFGMACALDTLCGQAFGARQRHLLGVHKQRAMLVLAAVSVPVAAAWAYAGEILARCGQDLEIAAATGRYIRWVVPALFAYGPLQCHVRFLQSQNAVSYLANVLFMAIYIRLSPSCKATWQGFSTEAFRGIPGFLKLAVPSALMLCIEWWSFELLVLLSGLLPNPKLETGVLSICLQTITFAVMPLLGLGASISTRVSNELGARRPAAARLATQVVIVLAFSVSVSEGIVMVLARNILGYAYTNNVELVKYTARIVPVLAVSILFDGLLNVLSGVIRGCGRQKLGAFINLVSYYIVGIPAAFFFAFVCNLGAMGLWCGLLCGLVVQMFLLLSVSLCTNWNEEALKAEDRVFSCNLSVDMRT